MKLNKRKEYLDYLRAFACFCVVILHTSAIFWRQGSAYSFEWNILNFWNSIVRWTVPVFIMISGALFLNENYLLSIRKLYTKNILKILSVYWIWSIIYSFTTMAFNNKYDVLHFLFYIVNGHYHMWFLLLIIGLYIIIPILKSINLKNNIRYFLILTFFLTFFVNTIDSILTIMINNGRLPRYIYDTIITIIHNFNFNFPIGYTAYFVFGYYFDTHTFNLRQKKLIYCLSIFSFITTITLTYFVSSIEGKPNELFYSYLQMNVFFEAAGIFLFIKNNYKSIKHYNLIKFISQNSLGIYLVHALILEIFIRIKPFTSISLHFSILVPIIALVIFIISMTISVTISRIPKIGKYIV